MIIAGLSGLYHDAACCLMIDGEVVSAVQEGRLTGIKDDGRLPVAAWRWCLERAGLGPQDVDVVAWYEDPAARAERRAMMGLPALAEDPARAIRERLGFEGPLRCFEHHAAHRAAAFLFSPFDAAAVATVDAVGGWETATFAAASGVDERSLASIRFPHSVGLLYSAVTSWLGFPVLSGEARVMGLAGWGEPSLSGALRRLIADPRPDRFRLDLRYFDFGGPRLYSDALVSLLGPPRSPGGPLTDHHRAVAASLQALLESWLLEAAGWLRARSGLDALCLGGGVALNCAANGRLLRDGPFPRIWVQPAAGDAGSCLGAAALAWVERTGRRPAPLEHMYLGPGCDGAIAGETAAGAEDFSGREAALLDEVVERLAAGEVLGWARGRMEFGPRALGARSILADPRRPDMKDRLNRQIKRREGFRPFAPCVLEEDAAALFGCAVPSPYMLFTFPVLSDELPAITHADGSARVQTVGDRHDPGLAALLRAWRARTGCPALLNTSLNVKGAPIACTASDALMAAADAGLDALVLGDHLVAALPGAWPALVRAWRPARADALHRDLYTF